MKSDKVLKSGTTLQGGRYVVGRVLGQGGFGITYEAMQMRPRRRVALKEFFMGGLCGRGKDGNTVVVPLNDNQIAFKIHLRRFFEEAEKLAKLHNTHIVPVYDSFDENETSYYVMDFIEGESLSEKLKNHGNQLDEKDVMDILKQMLDALACIHHQAPPLFHLDIKPENIMMEKDNKVVLVDFGASKYISASDALQSNPTLVAYTRGYAPLEQLSGIREDMGAWTDFYALGATMFNLLTGKRPAEPSIIVKDSTPDKSKSIPLPDTISPLMRKLVLWMMAPIHSFRPQSEEEIWQVINEAIPEKQTAAEDSEATVVGSDDTVEIEVVSQSGKETTSEKEVEIDVKNLQDDKYLMSLQLTDAQSVLKWYDVFQQNDCLRNKGVISAFSRLFGLYVVPELKTMKEVVECMRKYPFIPVEYFKPPQKVYLPNDLLSLGSYYRDAPYRELILKWVRGKFITDTSFNINDVVRSFYEVLKPKDAQQLPVLEKNAKFKVDQLILLLLDGNYDHILNNCEQLIRVAVKLPEKWDPYMYNTLLPAVRNVLLGGRILQTGHPSLSKKKLLDVREWSRIARLQEMHPLVFKVVKERLRTLFELDVAPNLGNDIKEHFIHVPYLNHLSNKGIKNSRRKREKWRFKEDVSKYHIDAEDAYPIIRLYISTIRKTNKNMSKELKRLFSELKRTKYNWARIRLIVWVCTAIICALGGLVAGKYVFNKSSLQSEGEIAIMWEGDKKDNLMNQLANVIEFDSAIKVKVDTLEMPLLKLEKTADLLPLSNAYYGMDGIERADSALVRVYEFNEEGKQRGDIYTIFVTPENPLLKSVYDKKYRLKDVTIKGKTIEINNAVLLGDEKKQQSTKDAKYYLSVVKYLSRELPEGVHFAY